MIDKICNYLTKKIRKQMPEVDDERAEVINYGLHIVVGEVPKTFVFVAIAVLMGILKEFLITFFIILPYRTCSGGFHLKTHIGCIIATTCYYCGIAYISRYQLFGDNIKYILIPLIWILGMIMCKLYAPADTENIPILRKKERRIKQILSYAILTVTLIIGLIINNYIISNIIILGMLIQSIMISRIAYKLTNNKYGHEVFKEEQINNLA